MVRSSGIGEDSAESSFAGQLDSFQTDNNLESVVENIIKCWDSMKNSRTIEYGKKVGKPITNIAVIIQEMIEPEYAGVFFTISPVTQEGMHIEYTNGHAEKLVQGEVTPEKNFTP